MNLIIVLEWHASSQSLGQMQICVYIYKVVYIFYFICKFYLIVRKNN